MVNQVTVNQPSPIRLYPEQHLDEELLSIGQNLSIPVAPGGTEGMGSEGTSPQSLPHYVYYISLL